MKDTPTNTPIGELEKKQLEELHHDIFTCFTSISYQDSAVVAESLYNKGYSKQKEGKWISVDERLPEKEGLYLVCTSKRTVLMSFYIDYLVNGKPQWELYDVTHWMSLPKPPTMKGS